MEKVNIDKTNTIDKRILYYLSHPTADEPLRLEENEFKELYDQMRRKLTTSVPKHQLIIHETDCHGQGNVIYGDKIRSYTYDDGGMGDVKGAVEGLIDIGFIDSNDVTIIEGDEIYQHLNIK